jgi:predicted RNA-binding Zn-ribbon protein involved in translation (DUF1610 family)
MKQITELIEAADVFFNKCHCVDDGTASRLDRAINEARECAKGKELTELDECSSCGYDMTGTIDLARSYCPSCGLPIKARPK